jgi:hypothetical protein
MPMYIFIYVPYIQIYLCTHRYTSNSAPCLILLFRFPHMYIYMYTYIYTYIYSFIYLYIYTHVHAHEYILYTYTYIHIYLYILILIYLEFRPMSDSPLSISTPIIFAVEIIRRCTYIFHPMYI